MDWSAVGKLIVPLAPALGSVLGGLIPIPGGSLIGQLSGQAIGAVLAKKLGVEATPDAVAMALGASNDKDVLIAKINAAAAELRSTNEAYAKVERAYFEAVTKTSEAVNRTMQLEILPENRHWFFTGWRPAAGWVFVIYSFVFGGVLVWASVTAMSGDSKPLEALSAAWPVFAAYFGVLAAMVGVYVVARTADKVGRVDTTKLTGAKR